LEKQFCSAEVRLSRAKNTVRTLGALAPILHNSSPQNYFSTYLIYITMSEAVYPAEPSPPPPPTYTASQSIVSSYPQYAHYLPQIIPPKLSRVEHVGKKQIASLSRGFFLIPLLGVYIAKGAQALQQKRYDKQFEAEQKGIYGVKEKKVDKSNWQPDNDSDHCTRCSKKFNATKRRHHCRRCCQLVCEDCSKKREIVYEHPHDRNIAKRLCDFCCYHDLNVKQGWKKAGSPTNNGAATNQGESGIIAKNQLSFSQVIPPIYATGNILPVDASSLPFGLQFAQPVEQLAPGSAYYIVGTTFPIARVTNGQELMEATQAREKQVKGIEHFWSRPEYLAKQSDVYTAISDANDSCDPLSLKHQAILNCEAEARLYAVLVKELSELPPNSPQIAIATVWQKYTADLIDAALCNATPAALMKDLYLECIDQRSAAIAEHRRQVAVASAGATKLHVSNNVKVNAYY
jgi:hypothetical protein